MLLTIIVPVLNGKDYIPDLVGQFRVRHMDEVELLLVDNGSTDGSPDLISKCFTDSGIHFRILHSFQKGPGPARNLGLKEAQGKFVAFMDCDDKMDIIKLLELCHKMQAKDADLAIFNHCRSYVDGSVRTNNRSDLLAHSTAICSETEKLALLDNFNVAWNKVCRRSLIQKYRLAFSTGIYEDIPWSISVLFLAQMVLTESNVIYTYRQHPHSLLKSVGAAHLALSAQYQKTIEFCLEKGCSVRWRDALVDRAIAHGLLIAYQRKRMNLPLRVQSFSNLVRLVEQYNGFESVRKSRRLSSLQKTAFRWKCVGLLEVQHFVRRLARYSRRILGAVASGLSVK